MPLNSAITIGAARGRMSTETHAVATVGTSCVSPLSPLATLGLFAVPTLALWAATRWGIPWFHQQFGGPAILAWFFWGKVVFAGLFFAAIAAYWREACWPTLSGFLARVRLTRPRAADVAWGVGVTLVCGLGSALIFVAWRAAANASLLPAPDLSPPFLRMEPLTSETAWLLLAWLPMFFFNIMGEELWWRGYLLRRQEAGHLRAAVLVHAIGLAMFHLPLGVGVTVVLTPFLLGLPWVVMRRQNLWSSVVVHGLINGGGFAAVAAGLV